MTSNESTPRVVDRETWQAELDALRVREKEHTRAGDAIAAARRELPMAEVDGSVPVVGPNGTIVCYLRQGNQVFETYWTSGRGAEAMTPAYGLLDLTVYGRREAWESQPDGWPEPLWKAGSNQFRLGERPIAQWPRIEAGRSDSLDG